MFALRQIGSGQYLQPVGSRSVLGPLATACVRPYADMFEADVVMDYHKTKRQVEEYWPNDLPQWLREWPNASAWKIGLWEVVPVEQLTMWVPTGGRAV